MSAEPRPAARVPPPTTTTATPTKILRSPSRESVGTDLSLLSLSSLGSEMSRVASSLRVPLPSAASASEGGNDEAAGGGGRPRSSSCCDDSREVRGPSPNAEMGGVGRALRGTRNNLQVPGEHYGATPLLSVTAPSPHLLPSLHLPPMRRSLAFGFSASETLFEEESELIKSCGALSSALGLRKSFSTSDISLGEHVGRDSEDANEDDDRGLCGYKTPLKTCLSDLVLYGGAASAGAVGIGLAGGRAELNEPRLDYTSRSCSTWVAVGDMASTSQLPSPQGYPGCSGGGAIGGGGGFGEAPAITAAELVRSVNKKVRQGYIKRRLLTTYKALERIAQSELQLDRCGAAALEGSAGASVAMRDVAATRAVAAAAAAAAAATTTTLGGHGDRISKAHVSKEILKLLRKDFDPRGPGLLGTAKSLSLTVKDVEREKGKPLTKYERNMMIFNWLYNLEDGGALDRFA